MSFDIGDGIDSAVNYILDNFSPALDFIAASIGFVTNGLQNGLLS
ncbi:MAG: proline/glycine betaine ABC transporter permease, partial [Ensifer adhaerens]